jgi:small GTP-binding protein
LKLVKQYDFVTIREHIVGLKKNDYEFYDEYPNCKEVLILGSSNAGKSTLINSINGSKGLGGEKIAFTAKEKGKTFQLNFYHACHRHDRKKRQGMIVDSPGYGHTEAPTKLKEKWWRTTQKYLCYGIRINMILLCIPAHRGITGQDMKVINELKYFNKPVHIVLTKVDQVKNNDDLVKVLT